MAPSNAWNARALRGYAFDAQFQLQAGDGSPYPVAGATWEYVVRSTAADAGTPLIRITTTPGSQGQLIVTTGAATLVTVTLAASATLLPPELYAHALVMNPGTASAYAWITGAFIVSPVPQP